MRWFDNTPSKRQELFKTHSGKALIRSVARQAAFLEASTSGGLRKATHRHRRRPTYALGEQKSSEGYAKIQQHTSYPIKDRNQISKHIRGNPFLKRYASLIDNLALSSLPPEVENDTILHIADSKNATVENTSLNIQFAVVDGRLCFYPTQQIGQKVLCGSRDQAAAMFFNAANNKWTHGCNNSFRMVDTSIATRSGFREITLSSRDIRQALLLEDSVKLNVTHFFKYFFFIDN
uniref:Wsv134-like protein n=1 Tax=Metapenaeus ensis nimavirus TaxID=2133794 RepID=A0A401IPA1_9VIRU|nr:MAG: wsv134-like protein [Metapenaeus ensis nimavirus]GBG35448.1 wsv134-like protein [Metapenaeus ensis nimavirus]